MAKISRHTVHQFPVIVHEDEEKGYWVECPSFEGCFSQGDTIEDALKHIREAIELCLEEMPKTQQTRLVKQQVSLHLVSI
jgi:predicted RNase H-like HicB family nuclease